MDHGRRAWELLSTLGLVALVACGSSSVDASCPPSPFRQEQTLVIAHAGGEGLGPANTLEAMRASFAAGADVNDADVHITADGVLVAIHDDTVDATTDGTGKVIDHTLDELRALDAAWHFAGPGNDFPLRGAGVVIPTIDEVLTEFPDTLTSLEMKNDTGDAPKALCALLRRLDRTDDVYVSSDTDPAIEEFKTLCPEVTTTVTEAMVPPMLAAQESGEPWCSPVPIGQPPYRESRKPTAESVQWSHDHGLANFTWTVDDPETLRYLVEIGMDGVYTRRPDIARRIVDEASN